MWYLKWDSLVPYMEVDEALLAAVKRPLIVIGIPRTSRYGVRTKVYYGLVPTNPIRWTENQFRKFENLEKGFQGFETTYATFEGTPSADCIWRLGKSHFERFEIRRAEVEGLHDWAIGKECVLIQVRSPGGEWVLNEFDVLIEEANQLYGSFCCWNPDFKARSPGLYACYLASRYAERRGIDYYNLGSVYPYKIQFCCMYEDVYGMALIDPEHPLASDPKSPFNEWFDPETWNVTLRRNDPRTHLR